MAGGVSRQDDYALQRQQYTRRELERWVRMMVDMGEPAKPATFACQQDQPQVCACYEGANKSGVECACAAADAWAAVATIYEPGPLRDAWMAGRDAAALEAMRAALADCGPMAVACRAAKVMPEVEL